MDFHCLWNAQDEIHLILHFRHVYFWKNNFVTFNKRLYHWRIHYSLHQLVLANPKQKVTEPVLPFCYEEKPQNLPSKKTQTYKKVNKVKTKLEKHTASTCT